MDSRQVHLANSCSDKNAIERVIIMTQGCLRAKTRRSFQKIVLKKTIIVPYYENCKFSLLNTANEIIKISKLNVNGNPLHVQK